MILSYVLHEPNSPIKYINTASSFSNGISIQLTKHKSIMNKKIQNCRPLCIQLITSITLTLFHITFIAIICIQKKFLERKRCQQMRATTCSYQCMNLLSDNIYNYDGVQAFQNCQMVLQLLHPFSIWRSFIQNSEVKLKKEYFQKETDSCKLIIVLDQRSRKYKINYGLKFQFNNKKDQPTFEGTNWCINLYQACNSSFLGFLKLALDPTSFIL